MRRWLTGGLLLLAGAWMGLAPHIAWAGFGLHVDGVARAWLLLGCLALAALAWAEQLNRRTLLALLPWTLAVCALDLRLVAFGAAITSALLGRSWLQRCAGWLQAGVWLWLGWQAHAWSWSAPTLGAFLTSWHVFVLMISAAFGLGLLPLGRTPCAPAPLLALLMLLPLFRIYAVGPINWGWAVAAALLGAGAALWCLWRAVDSATAAQKGEWLVLTWWATALAPVLLASEAALVASWSLALAALLALATCADHGRLAVLSAGALPPTLPFMALWLGAGAALTGGLAVLLLPLWLICVGTTLVLLTLQPSARWGTGRALLALVGGIGLPWLLERFFSTTLQQLGAGLSPFGRPLLWPWIGLSVRDAGSVTATTVPGVVLGALFMVAAAVGVLLWRWRSTPPTDTSVRLRPPTLWRLLRQRLPLVQRDRPSDDL